MQLIENVILKMPKSLLVKGIFAGLLSTLLVLHCWW
jgi:hypothetical protein